MNLIKNFVTLSVLAFVMTAAGLAVNPSAAFAKSACCEKAGCKEKCLCALHENCGECEGE